MEGNYISQSVKEAIFEECMKRFDPSMGRLVKNGFKEIEALFPEVASVSIRTLFSYYRKQVSEGAETIDVSKLTLGRQGRHSKLTDELKQTYKEIALKEAEDSQKLSLKQLQDELTIRGFPLSVTTIRNHIRYLNGDVDKDYKPLLVPTLPHVDHHSVIEYQQMVSKAPLAILDTTKNKVDISRPPPTTTTATNQVVSTSKSSAVSSSSSIEPSPPLPHIVVSNNSNTVHESVKSIGVEEDEVKPPRKKMKKSKVT